jgi:hypothetical protein
VTLPVFDQQGVGENDFKAAMDAVDAAYLNEMIQSTDKTERSVTDVAVKDDGTTEEDIEVRKNLIQHASRTCIHGRARMYTH